MIVNELMVEINQLPIIVKKLKISVNLRKKRIWNSYAGLPKKIDRKYIKDIEEYKYITELAKGINKSDLPSFAHVVETFDPFKEIAEFGSDIECTIISNTEAKAIISINDSTV